MARKEFRLTVQIPKSYVEHICDDGVTLKWYQKGGKYL
jgi:hypothetical protein